MALSFRALGFPVELRWSFALVALGLGWIVSASLLGTVTFGALLFASVLVHELGHALSAQVFGLAPRIVLYALGGVTAWSPLAPLGRRARIVVAVAGPLAGLALALAAYVVYTQASHWPHVEDIALKLVLINAGLSVVNLMPIQPFDGGNALAAALGPERRTTTALVSAVFGVTVAVVLARFGLWVGAAVFFTSAMMNLTAGRHLAFGSDTESTEAALDGPLDRARTALEAGDVDQARAIAMVVLRAAPSDSVRRRCMELLAWTLLSEGHARAAQTTLSRVPERETPQLDAYLCGAVAEANGDCSTAARVLESARASGDCRLELAALLVRVYLRLQKYEQAVELARTLIDSVDVEDIRRVARESRQGRSYAAAANLSGQLFAHTRDGQDALDAATAHAHAQQFDEAVRALREATSAGITDPERDLGEADRAALRRDARIADFLARAAEPS